MTDNEMIGRILRLAGRREPVPDDAEARVLAGAHEAWRATLRRRARRRSMAVAAAVVIGAGSALLLVRLVAHPPAREAARVEITSGRGPLAIGARIDAGDLVTTAGERLAMRLVSGTGVRVDHDSRVRVLNGSTLDLLDGAIHVVSARGGDPVEIRTPLGRVRDIGTRFEVRCVAQRVRVRVRDGRVSLTDESGRHDVVAGEELTTAPGTAPQRRAVARTGPEWDWATEVAPPFLVEGRTLGQFLAWFSAETGRHVRFRDPADARRAEAIVLHGSANDFTPDEALDAVLPAVGIAAVRSGDDVLLERRP
jgi:ferric-dicitrate binding protein FerR (iron transport regulator)